MNNDQTKECERLLNELGGLIQDPVKKLKFERFRNLYDASVESVKKIQEGKLNELEGIALKYKIKDEIIKVGIINESFQKGGI
ncbi:MAG: hypothetical protein R3321_11615 [Nitrososphaeraceae archaeon]|nr:hypothetical protein [Nitrososphaeraceae archaeon]